MVRCCRRGSVGRDLRLDRQKENALGELSVDASRSAPIPSRQGRCAGLGRRQTLVEVFAEQQLDNAKAFKGYRLKLRSSSYPTSTPPTADLALEFERTRSGIIGSRS